MLLTNTYGVNIEIDNDLSWQQIMEYLLITEETELSNRSDGKARTKKSARMVVSGGLDQAQLDNAMRAIYELKDLEIRQAQNWAN